MTTTIETQLVTCACCGSSQSSVIARGRDYIYHGSENYLTHMACTSCGHIYLNPQPVRAALPVMYPPHYGTFSSKFRGKQNPLAAIKTRINLKRFTSIAGPLRPGMRILDVGCGNGELLRTLAQAHPELDLYGLDWHFPKEVRADLEAAGIHLIEGALEAADLPTAPFDLILMYQLIEHLWDPEGGVKRLAAALKPGGCIAIETPDTDGYDRRWFAAGTWGGYYAPRHLNLYNFERLANLLARAGLEVVSQKSLPAPIVWCYSLQGWLQERFGSETRLATLFDIRNLAALAAFAALDTSVAAFGGRTSNQQAVAMRPAATSQRA